MELITENLFPIFLAVFMILLLITYLTISFKKLKITEKNRLQSVFLDLEIEEKNTLALQNIANQINALEKKTKLSFLKINVAILNIDFSYEELLKKI